MNAEASMDAVTMVDKLFTTCQSIIDEFELNAIQITYEVLDPKRFRFTLLNLPNMGQWEEIYTRVFGNKLTHNQYVKYYPEFVKNHYVGNKTKFPSCERVLYFIDHDTRPLREEYFTPVINPINSDACLVVHGEMMIFMLSCLEKVLFNIKNLYTSF